MTSDATTHDENENLAENLEYKIDQVFQSAFKAVRETAEEELEFQTFLPHPSTVSFMTDEGSIDVQLGEGLSYRNSDGEEITEEELTELVGEDEFKALCACAEMWYEIGKKQGATLSVEYLESYM